MCNKEKILEVKDLSFGYSASQGLVLKNVNLSVDQGACLSILGESGSGKTTLLKIMCGLLKPDSGSVIFEGKELDGPDERISIMFQNYGLLPWKTVRQNVVLPVQIRGEKPDRVKVSELLKYLGLEAHADKYPGALSGGQKQRCALGRAVMSRSRLILIDEPFSALDIKNRGKLQLFIKKFLKDMDMSCVMVTHSVEEALTMGDQLAIFDAGEGRISELFEGMRGREEGIGSDQYYQKLRRIQEILNREMS